jgi:hypothetical protein
LLKLALKRTLGYTSGKGAYMTVPGEGSQGGQHNYLTEQNYLDLLNQMDQAGWFSAGSWGDGLPISIGIIRLEGRGNASPDEAIARLNLADEEGNLLPGYEVHADEQSGMLSVGYEGPAGARYQQFLEDMIGFGDDLDKSNIQASPYPGALEQWSLRHHLWAQPHRYESLEPHISEELKDVRDHVAIEKNGVTSLLMKLADYAEVDWFWTRLAIRRAVGRTQDALAMPTPEDRDNQVDFALQEIDGLIQRMVEAQELSALRNADVALAFTKEVLVVDPRFDSEPLSEVEFEELVDFKDDSSRDREWKLAQLAQVIYHAHRSITPQGLKMMFHSPIDLLEGKKPWDVIDHGTTEENRRLYDWAVNSRSMPMS